VHPVALQFGSLTITSYGVMMALAFMVGIWDAGRRAPAAGLNPEKITDLGPWIIIGALVAARALYVVTFWREQFAGAPLSEIFMVWHGGLVFYGGFVGAALATIIWAKYKKLPMWTMGDVLAPSLALGYVFGRMGCLLNGCCYGRECTLSWAIRFPEPHATFPHAVHPTQIYDAMLSFVLFLILRRIFIARRFDGQVFVSWLVGYALCRSGVEFFRGDYSPELRSFGGWLTPAQVASIFILATAVILWRVLPRQLKTPAAIPARNGKKPQAVEKLQ